MSLAEVAEVVGGQVARDDGVMVTGPAFIDSRQVVPGGLFVAVAGEHVDGHAYAEAAVEAGAAAVLGTSDTGVPAVIVADPVAALGRLARHVLDALPDVTVLALTGSQGKTGTKDYLAQVLTAVGPTVATAGNFNNEIGVPLTVLRATPETSYLVVEMGARGIGHIGYLCELAPPRVAAVINVGTAHIGEFGGQAAIAQAKGEIVEALPPDGTAVLNADDELTAAMGERTSAHVLSFGSAGDVTWRGLELDELGRPTFEIGYDGRWRPVRLGQAGEHQVPNAAAAAAMALAIGVGLDVVAHALTGSVATSRWRMELHERPDGLVVVNDAYNANPASMRAAIQTVARIGSARDGRSVAVLGVMLELGDESAAAHADIGRVAAEAGLDVVVTVGPEAEAIAAGARAVPGWPGEAIVTASRDEALRWVMENVSAPDVVLVKASRGAALEHVADALIAHRPPERGSR